MAAAGKKPSTSHCYRGCYFLSSASWRQQGSQNHLKIPLPVLVISCSHYPQWVANLNIHYSSEFPISAASLSVDDLTSYCIDSMEFSDSGSFAFGVSWEVISEPPCLLPFCPGARGRLSPLCSLYGLFFFSPRIILLIPLFHISTLFFSRHLLHSLKHIQRKNSFTTLYSMLVAVLFLCLWSLLSFYKAELLPRVTVSNVCWRPERQ